MENRSLYDIDVDVSEDADKMQDALMIVEWMNPFPGAGRCVLLFLHWVVEGIAERLDLLGNYGYELPSVRRSMNKVPRRKVKFELR